MLIEISQEEYLKFQKIRLKYLKKLREVEKNDSEA